MKAVQEAKVRGFEEALKSDDIQDLEKQKQALEHFKNKTMIDNLLNDKINKEAQTQTDTMQLRDEVLG